MSCNLLYLLARSATIACAEFLAFSEVSFIRPSCVRSTVAPPGRVIFFGGGPFEFVDGNGAFVWQGDGVNFIVGIIGIGNADAVHPACRRIRLRFLEAVCKVRIAMGEVDAVAVVWDCTCSNYRHQKAMQKDLITAVVRPFSESTYPLL